jgi:hypothetical protein
MRPELLACHKFAKLGAGHVYEYVVLAGAII